MNEVGYIAPVNQFQYIQYGNRVGNREKNKDTSFKPVKETSPAFAIQLKNKTEEYENEIQTERNTSEKRGNPSRPYSGYQESNAVRAPGITGKGLLLDQII